MNKPFLLKPSGKDYLWGGNRINEDFGKDINLSPLAESWECSVHEDGPSFVSSGEHKGKSCDQAFLPEKKQSIFWLCSRSKESGVFLGWVCILFVILFLLFINN